MKCEKVFLSEVCDLVPGYAFRGKDFGDFKDKVIKITHITPPTVDMDNLVGIDIDKYDISKLKKFIAQKGDYVLAMTGATIGKIGRVERGCAYVNQRVLLFKNKKCVDKNYLYYVLKQKEFEQYVFNHIDSNSAQPNISASTIGNFSFDLPDLVFQKKIGDGLRLLDEKIAINRAINENLLEQIRTLCNAWLNDYVPFGGECPDDWKLTPLASFAKFISGYSYKGNELQASTTAMATIKNFDRKGGFKLDGYKEIIPSSKLKPEHHAELFDTLVAHTDITQNAEVIGNAEPVLSFSGYDDIIFSMDVVKVILDSPAISKFLIAAMLQTQRFKGHCLGYVNGTTVLHLSKKALSEYSLRLPHDFKVLQPLDDAVSSMYQQMALNIDENIQLATLRNSLLPKLMTGELDISNFKR